MTYVLVCLALWLVLSIPIGIAVGRMMKWGRNE